MRTTDGRPYTCPTEGLSLPCVKGGGTAGDGGIVPPACLYNPPPPFGQSPLCTRGPILPFDGCAAPASDRSLLLKGGGPPKVVEDCPHRLTVMLCIRLKRVLTISRHASRATSLYTREAQSLRQTPVGTGILDGPHIQCPRQSSVGTAIGRPPADQWHLSLSVSHTL